MTSFLQSIWQTMESILMVEDTEEEESYEDDFPNSSIETLPEEQPVDLEPTTASPELDFPDKEAMVTDPEPTGVPETPLESLPLMASLDSLTSEPQRIQLHGRLPTTSPLLTEDMVAALHASLPPLQQLASAWHLVYSLDQHGMSIHTLYDRTQVCLSTKTILPRGLILVIQDAQGSVFGAYLSDPFKVQANFFGSGETFVMRWDPAQKAWERYGWTGMNDYFLFCELTYFAIGAGDGHFALYLDESLHMGKSHPVVTFDNPCLANQTEFETWELEVWGFAT